MYAEQREFYRLVPVLWETESHVTYFDFMSEEEERYNQKYKPSGHQQSQPVAEEKKSKERSKRQQDLEILVEGERLSYIFVDEREFLGMSGYDLHASIGTAL